MKRALLAVAFLLSGCVTPATEVQFKNSAVINRGEPAVWDGLIDYFTSRNIQIRTIERDSGVIYAERARFDPAMANCDINAGVVDIEGTVTLNVFVRDLSPAQTQVTVNTQFSQVGLDPWSKRMVNLTCYSTGLLEREMLAYLGGSVSAPATPVAATSETVRTAPATAAPSAVASAAPSALPALPTQTQRLPGHRLAAYGCPGFAPRVLYAESAEKLPKNCERVDTL